MIVSNLLTMDQNIKTKIEVNYNEIGQVKELKYLGVSLQGTGKQNR